MTVNRDLEIADPKIPGPVSRVWAPLSIGTDETRSRVFRCYLAACVLEFIFWKGKDP